MGESGGQFKKRDTSHCNSSPQFISDCYQKKKKEKKERLVGSRVRATCMAASRVYRHS